MVEIFDDAAHGHAHLAWVQVQWSSYNNSNGETCPVVGDIDGDGRDEIIIGLGAGGNGWYEIFDDAHGNYAHVAWKQVEWPAYNSTNGAT